MGSSGRVVISSLLDSFALRADIVVQWPNWSVINLRTRGLHLTLPVVSPVFAITQRQYVRDIFYKGLMPSQMVHAGGRRHVNLSPFLPHDPRNTAVGRQQDIYDTVIIFKKDRVLSEHEMLLSANGIVATTEVLNSDLFQLIYVVPSGQYSKRWVLYDPDLHDLVPSGYTAMEMSRPYYKDVLWEHERRVANDSYACPNPNCCLFNPEGFTACVTCGWKFTFEVVVGPSKVALPVAGSTPDDAEITKTTALESQSTLFVPKKGRSISIKITSFSGDRSFAVWTGE